jgi:antirestriction protein
MKLLSKTGEKIFERANKKKIVPDSLDKRVKRMTPVLLKTVPELKESPENPVVRKTIGTRKEDGHWVIYNKVTGETLPQRDNNFETQEQAESAITLASKAAYAKGGQTNKSNTMSDNARIYVADLAAYNDGKLIGEWLDLDDYSSGSEVMDAINELMEKWSKEQGEDREEYAIHDYENLPKSFYSENMGETDFDAYYEAKKVADDRDIPVDVLLEWMGDHGVDDPETAGDAYQGKYDDMEDFAYRMVEDGVISDTSDYITISDTDRRILAGEEADAFVEDMNEDDAISQADMQDELTELEDKRDEEEDKEDSDFDFDDEKEKLAEKAKEKLREEKYGYVEDELKDPVQYFVEDHGMYSKEDLAKASFVQVDYAALARDLSHDYDEVRYEGDSYIFSNNYASGGKVRKKAKGGPAAEKKEATPVDDGSIKKDDKVKLNETVINERISVHSGSPNSSSSIALRKLKKLIGETGTVYAVGKTLVAVSFPNGQSVTVKPNYLHKVSFASGGKPIGSTGLFAKGGKVSVSSLKRSMKELTVKEALDKDIIFKENVDGAKKVYEIVDEKGSNVYAIIEDDKGKFLTVVNSQSEYGTLDKCLGLVAADINFDK